MPMAHGYLHNKWFGFIGIFLANLSLVGYLFNWTLSGMALGASVMMLFFIWMFILGFSTIRAHKIEVSQ